MTYHGKLFPFESSCNNRRPSVVIICLLVLSTTIKEGVEQYRKARKNRL